MNIFVNPPRGEWAELCRRAEQDNSLIAERDLLLLRAECECLVADSIELVLWGEVKTTRKESEK